MKEHLRILEQAARGALPDEIDEESDPPVGVVRELVEAGYLWAIDATTLEGAAFLNPYGGTQDLVLIPELKQRDREYYLAIANVVCGERTECSVNFWTDRTHIPTSAKMQVTDLAVMTASYARSPRYTAPVLSLACWLYPNREIAELNKCAYSPGAVVPWKSPTEDAIRKFQ